jgi:hypothetical protein
MGPTGEAADEEYYERHIRYEDVLEEWMKI